MKSFNLTLLCVLFFLAGFSQFVNPAQYSSPVRVACVGNSITYGSGIADREHDSYPAQLGRMLGGQWEVRNFGVSGRTMLKNGDFPYWKEQAYTQAKAFLPDVVIIKLGTNDSKPQNWKYASEYLSDYKAMVEEFKNLPSHPIIYVCIPVPAFENRWGINNSIIVNEVIPDIELLAKEQKLPLINLYDSFLGKAYLFPDRIHPNAAGAGLIAEFIYKELTGKETLLVKDGNPVIKDIGMSDPHIRVFNDTIYLFSGHDGSPNDTTWVMKDWRVFSTSDLIHWDMAATISPKDNYMGENSQDCWAGDAATKNGKYYFYFSDRKRGIGVMTADSPHGPFKDALGKPLISPMHDPTTLIDDDPNQTPYIFYGDKEGSYHVARLNSDMISLAELPVPIVINGKEWESAPQWMDKNYIFKQNGSYYLSWGRDYAVSKNIYGPYQCVGSVGNGHHLSEYAHGSFFWWKGQFYHIWCYYLRPGYKYRECIITYCHFDNQGKIVTDTGFLDKHFANGVGQYNAAWPEIQAEWYYEKSKDLRKTENKKGEFEISSIGNDSWLRFSNVDFGNEPQKFIAKISNIVGKGTLELRLDSLSGESIGKLFVEPGNSDNFLCNLTKVSGKRDLFLKFNGSDTKLFNLDWFRFSDFIKSGQSETN